MQRISQLFNLVRVKIKLHKKKKSSISLTLTIKNNLVWSIRCSSPNNFLLSEVVGQLPPRSLWWIRGTTCEKREQTKKKKKNILDYPINQRYFSTKKNLFVNFSTQESCILKKKKASRNYNNYITTNNISTQN